MWPMTVQSIELRTNQAYRLVSEPDPRGSGYETTYRHVLVLTATRSGYGSESISKLDTYCFCTLLV